MTTINDVWVAHKEATGRWSGCNWRTRYGSLDLDLDGVSSGRAQRTAQRWRTIAADELDGDEITAGEEASLVDMALHLRLRGTVARLGEDRRRRLAVCGDPARRFCAEALVREWEFAACWLEEIESDARWAEEEAHAAVSAAEDGDWEQAVGHVRQACSIESIYDAPQPWTYLKQAIENAASR